MSRVTVKSGCKNRVTNSIEDFAQLGEQLINFSTRQSRLVLTQTMNLLESTLPSGAMTDLFRRSCKIPETECPPHCVCEFTWCASQGERGHFTVRLTNTGSKARNYEFTAGPFIGPGNPGSRIEVSPQAAELKPRESVIINLSHVVTEEFLPNNKYQAEVLIRGAYEQRVCMTLHVEPTETGHCEIEQGDRLTRIRAHRWYDHFQCEEPCQESGTRR